MFLLPKRNNHGYQCLCGIQKWLNVLKKFEDENFHNDEHHD
jgi:hypothetical protein